MDSTDEIIVDESLINGYVIFSADNLEQAADICRQCPLFHEGKTMELRELPNNLS